MSDYSIERLISLSRLLEQLNNDHDYAAYAELSNDGIRISVRYKNKQLVRIVPWDNIQFARTDLLGYAVNKMMKELSNGNEEQA